MFSLAMFAYCAIYIYTYYSLNNILLHVPDNYDSTKKSLEPNEIGDSIGGILNPMIGLLASVLTFLAFYMQKIANDDIKNQFKIQQFESQFYEMLRLHKENVNEIEVLAKDTNVKFDQSETFEVVSSLSFLRHNFKIKRPLNASSLRIYKGREAFRIMKNEFEIYYLEARTIKLNEIEEDDFHAAYELFFWGVNGYARHDKRGLWQRLQPVEFIDKLQQKIVTIINNSHDEDPINIFFNHETLKEVVLGNGYSAHLGHYYRHLFHTVKFIAEKKELNYIQKRNYLKILRGQLSNYEQVMLFYNWMSNYGNQWENDSNNYFTKYKMIHNLWYNELNLDDYMKKKLFCLVNKYEKLKKTDKEMVTEKSKTLFESGDESILQFAIDPSNCK